MRLSGNTVEIAIVDHGEEIAPEMLPHIFERFRQAARSITRQHGGMGLGLAIARHLLDSHGGTVNATSAGPGQGATFTVRLPMFAEVAAGSEADSVPDRDSGSRPENPLAGIHALAVDDDANALGM